VVKRTAPVINIPPKLQGNAEIARAKMPFHSDFLDKYPQTIMAMKLT
jgi:hypothetical protein